MVVFHNDIINAIAQARNIRHLLASDILERWQQGEEATAEQTQSLIQLGDWIDFLTDSEQLIVEDCIDSTDVWNIIQKIGEQAIGLDCVGTNYNYNNPPPTPTPNVFNYVESVTGLNTNNADPQNPVVRISVDGVTITGDGTPASPLVASIPPSGVQSVTDDGNGVVSVDNTDPVNPIVEFNGVSVDPLTLSGDGTSGSPLTVIGGGGGGGSVTSVSATAGAGVSVSVSNPTTTPNITVTNTDTGSAQNIFKNVAVAGNSTIVADNNDDTLTLQAGTAISISTNATTDTIRIENTAPDQTVVLNAGTGIGVSGTYPNFTISNTNSGNASIANITVTSLQGLQSTSSLSTTTLYNVTDAVGNTLVLQVYAIANNTNVVYAIDVASGTIGTYNITTDTFTATIPDLQQVTDVGFTTTNRLVSDDGAGNFTSIGNGLIEIATGNTGNVQIDATQATASYVAQLPDKPTGTETFAMLSDLTGLGGITKATAAGTDTYTTTITGVASYTDGDTYLIRFTNGNTTGATLNINSLGAKTLYRNNDGAVIGGDIWNGAEMLCVFNSTLDGFQCIGTSPNSLFAYVTNDDSVTITKGQVVYAFGGTGDRMTVKLANNTSDATSARTVGVVFSASIAANQKGIIILQGLIDGLSILGSPFVDGDSVYLGATNGAITRTKPYAPNHLVYVGTVTTASAGSSGRMYVKIQNGYELDEIHDVSAQTPVDGDTLIYNSSNGLWEANFNEELQLVLTASFRFLTGN